MLYHHKYYFLKQTKEVLYTQGAHAQTVHIIHVYHWVVEIQVTGFPGALEKLYEQVGFWPRYVSCLFFASFGLFFGGGGKDRVLLFF